MDFHNLIEVVGNLDEPQSRLTYGKWSSLLRCRKSDKEVELDKCHAHSSNMWA